MEYPNRRISNRYFRHFLQAIEEEMGGHTLRMVLRQTELERFVVQLPPLNVQTVSYASELAALQQAIHAYYGMGARGSLNRIGRATWHFMVAEAPLLKKIRLQWIKLTPKPNQYVNILSELVAIISKPDGKLFVELEDTALAITDKSCDFSYGQTSNEPICWVTQGMIQEAILWVSGEYFDVAETACRATGDDFCKFSVNIKESKEA
jgi:predicted hydrocarbon binding protein